MADVFSVAKRSEIMSRVKGRGNKVTELRLVFLFRKYRVRGWRRNANVFGSPDFVFPASRLAVFVDGCFWHCCRKHGVIPATNADFWTRKLRRNMARDRLVNRTLDASGWRVLRIWQHELAVANERRLVRRVQSALAPTSQPEVAFRSASTHGD